MARERGSRGGRDSGRDSGSRDSSRANHGSGTRRSGGTASSAQRARDGPRRANHGSGTRRTAAAGSRETHQHQQHRRHHHNHHHPRPNHGSGTSRAVDGSSGRRSQRANADANAGGGWGRHRRGGHHERSGGRGRRDDYDYEYEYEDSGNDGCVRFVRCLWNIPVAIGGFLLSIACLGACQRANTENASGNRRRRRPREGDDRWMTYRYGTVRGGLGLSLLLFLVLFQNSKLDHNRLATVDKSTGTTGILTMFRDETFRVPTPRFTREVRVTVASRPQPSRGMKAAVFLFFPEDGGCPRLDGPEVELRHDSQYDLAPREYVYDYYNLNPGSTVDVRFHQRYGGTYFYLLKGARALRDIRDGTTDWHDWAATAVAQHHALAGPESSLHYRTSPHDRDDGDNIYTLVYDNESDSFDSEIDVETDISRPTHDLYGAVPVCDNMGRGHSCSFSASRSDCVVLEAFLSSSRRSLVAGDDEDEGEGERRPDLDGTPEDDDDKTISFRIETYRNWESIGLLSVVPLAVSILLFVVLTLRNCCCSAGSPTEGDNDDDDDDEVEEGLEEPLLAREDETEVERPPPTAPHHVPEASAAAANDAAAADAAAPPPPMPPASAPPSEDDVVVVPAENVEVVTK